MKVLILDDASYKTVVDELKAAGTSLPRTKPLKLPSPQEMTALARNGGEPEPFARLREQTEAISDAQEQVREQLHSLLRQADAVGVKPGALARWSGYSDRRVHQITRAK